MIRKVLTIAGSDSGGGAGIQADIKTISACGCYAASVITAITAQNTLGVQAVEPLSAGIIEKQLRSVMDDIGADAVKIGMLATPEIVELIAVLLNQYKPAYIVLDPVLVATSGDTLTRSEAAEAIIRYLMPLATVITPNMPEASILTGVPVRRESDFTIAWDSLREAGAQAALIKAGHLEGDALMDMLYTPDRTYSYPHPRIATENTHGTGCTLSSAIASYLALGQPLPEATRMATDYVQGALTAGATEQIGEGHGPVNHFYRLWR